MKRTLAVILAMLTLLGIFAIGAAAADVPRTPFAPSGLSQQIMRALLFLPNRISPGWADGVVDYLAFFSAAVPPPFNWLIVWFLHAL